MARKKADDPNLKIQGITQSHVWNYCKDNLDMNKLWGMKESRSGKLLSGQLPSSLDIENENLDKEGRKIGSDVIKNSSMSLISENDDANIFENSSTHNILAAFTKNINPDKSEANDKVKYIRMTLDEDQAASSGLLPVRMVRSLQQKGNHSFKLKKVPPGSSGNKESSSNPLYHSYPPG